MNKQSSLNRPHAGSKWPAVKVESCNGVPTFTLEGKPWYGLAAHRPRFGAHFEAYERLTSAGMKHLQFDATSAEDIYHPELRFWVGEGEYDPTAQEAVFQHLSEINPDAYFTLRLAVNAPDWWLAKHPEECQVYADGSIERELQRAGVRRLPSLASPLWIAEANRALEHYLRWLEESGWSQRVVGIFLCNGITWEWGLLGTDGLPDLNPHAVRYFREYLKRRYSSEAALSAAWGRPVSFEEAEIPSPAERLRSHGEGGLRTLPEEQAVVDHQQSISEMNVDFLLSLAATAKRVSDREAVVGAFYGYTITAREQNQFTGTYGAGGFFGGHHAFARALRSPDIDFYASPFHYANRSLGTGVLYEHLPLASAHLHGKAFWDENDLWTYKNPVTAGALPPVMSVGYTPTLVETILMYRRAWATAMVRGKHQWFTELSGWIGNFHENFDDPDFLREVARFQESSEILVQRDRSSACEVAFVLDEKSIAYLSADHKGFLRSVYEGTVRWGYLGFPIDIILLEDLDLLPERYRIVIPACVKSPDAIATLKAFEQRSKAVVWWDGCASWYPPNDCESIREACLAAGVHCYLEGASVSANATMITVHVAVEGRQTLHFPRPVSGIEFFTGKPFGAPHCTLDWDFEEKGVALFLYESVSLG